jgi:hypothetical protein
MSFRKGLLCLAAACFLAPAAKAETWTWDPATGPVEGYRVEIQFPCEDWWRFADVRTNHVILRGQPGMTIRLRVLALGTGGQLGTVWSEPGWYYTFPALAPATRF